MKNIKLSNGRYATSSTHIIGKYGSVHTKAHYWSLDSDGQEIDDRHSIQSSYSKRALITNKSFNSLFRNAIKRGAVTHNKSYRRLSNSSWTYKIISYHIVYDTPNKLNILHDKVTRKNLVIEQGRKNKLYTEEKSLHKARNYIKLREEKLQSDKNLYNDKLLTKTEYNKMFKNPRLHQKMHKK